MTKLNHNRPYLRYIDNLRREIAIQSSRADQFVECSHASTVDSNDEIFPLTEHESSLVQEIFAALESYNETQITIISALSRTATKAQKLKAKGLSYDRVQAVLDRSVLRFASFMTIGALSGRMNLMNLYTKILQPEFRRNGGFTLEQLDTSMAKAMEVISKKLENISAGG